jgi:uncharacterized membrane protein
MGRAKPNVWIADDVTLEKYPELSALPFDALPESRWRSMRDTNLLACLAIWLVVNWATIGVARLAAELRSGDGPAAFAMAFAAGAVVVVPILAAFLAYRPILRWRLRRLAR